MHQRRLCLRHSTLRYCWVDLNRLFSVLYTVFILLSVFHSFFRLFIWGSSALLSNIHRPTRPHTTDTRHDTTSILDTRHSTFSSISPHCRSLHFDHPFHPHPRYTYATQSLYSGYLSCSLKEPPGIRSHITQQWLLPPLYHHYRLTRLGYDLISYGYRYSLDWCFWRRLRSGCLSCRRYGVWFSGGLWRRMRSGLGVVCFSLFVQLDGFMSRLSVPNGLDKTDNMG